MPDHVRALTRRDLLEGNVDPLELAAELLSSGVPRQFDVELLPAGLAITTTGLTSVDVYVNGRPATTADVSSGSAEVEVVVPAGGATLRVEGFDGSVLVASRQVVVGS